MGSKIKAIVTLVVAVAVISALHLYVYAPRKAKMKEYNDKLQSLSTQFRSIVSDIKSEEKNVSTRNLPTQVDNVINVIKGKIQTAKTGFEELDKRLKIIERYDPSIKYRDEVISQIVRMKQMEQTSNATKITISSSWGVDGGITEGRFGTGFHAKDGRAMAFANVKSHVILDPRQGSIEFFVKSDWDPSDNEVHHKCMFMALDSRKFTRDEITARMEADKAANEDTSNNPFMGSAMQMQQMLPMGPGPFQRDSMIAIYKGEGGTLSFELRDYVKPPSIVTAFINDWKPGQWYHVTAVWEAKKQALYINGQNRGVPYGGGQSIRDARDVEEDFLLGGGGGYGMGMMGMGGMGMMGMGMMGMGMGGMGMGGMGMGGMGMGGFGAAMGPTAGSALTSGISLPSVISGIYLGADETGSFPADCTFDDLRIQGRPVVSPPPSEEIQESESTLLVEHFNNELPASKDLPTLLLELQQYQKMKNIASAINPTIREYYGDMYEMLKHSLGIDTNFWAADPTTRTIHNLYILDYINKNTNRSFPELVGLLQIDPEILKNDSLQLHRIVEFQKLCYDLAQQAIDDQILSINEIVYKGHGYNVTDKELQDSFNSQLSTLQAELMGDNNLLVKYDWGGGGAYGMMGGMGMGGMGMGMMGMGGMGMMGMGMMGMGGGNLIAMFKDADTTDAALRLKAQQLGDLYWTDQIPDVDPEKIDKKLTLEEKMILAREIIGMVEDYKTFRKYKKDELIPPQVIEEYNRQMEQNGQDYYIKRSLTMDLDANYNSLMQYIYNIEYGSRVQTINALNITNKDNDRINALMDIDSHTLKNIAEEVGSPETGGISMK